MGGANLKLNPDTCTLRYAPRLVLDVTKVLLLNSEGCK